jgi:hypothetical protein
MDYGALFSRAWQVIWNNKFLIVLGILVVLTSASGNSGTQGSLPSLRGGDQGNGAAPFYYQPPDLDIGGGLEIAIIVLIALVILALVAAFWVLSTIARGGLIYGANSVDLGGSSSFSQAFGQGWSRALRLIGIGVVPAISTLLLIILGGLSLLGYTGVTLFDNARAAGANWLVVPVALLTCLLGTISLVLALLRNFAERACMLEDRGVFQSYRRAFEVLAKNFGSAIVLFILQIVVSLVIGAVLLLPGIFLALCCLLWPVLLLVQGTFAAYYSTLWTLAWSRWTTESEYPALTVA